jgi:hypothetical protein
MDFYDLENFKEYILPKYCFKIMFEFREVWAKKANIKPENVIKDLDMFVLARKQP